MMMALNVVPLRESIRRAQKENGGLQALGEAFYTRLFEKYPSVRPLFPDKMEAQASKLMAAVGWVVANVEHPATFKPYVEEMAIRHLEYGTLEPHYDAVGETLVEVMETHLRAEGDFSQEMKEAWIEAYDAIKKIMVS